MKWGQLWEILKEEGNDDESSPFCADQDLILSLLPTHRLIPLSNHSLNTRSSHPLINLLTHSSYVRTLSSLFNTPSHPSTTILPPSLYQHPPPIPRINPGWEWDWDTKSVCGSGEWYYRPPNNGILDAAFKARAVVGENKFAKQDDVRRYLKKTLWRKYEPTELSQQVWFVVGLTHPSHY